MVFYLENGLIEYIFDKVKERKHSVDIVTNGIDLDSFIEILTEDCLDHIQITLDGSKEIHDKRRTQYENICRVIDKSNI